MAVGQWDVMMAMEAGDSQARKDQVGPGVTAQFSQTASNSAGEVHQNGGKAKASKLPGHRLEQHESKQDFLTFPIWTGGER